VLWTDPNGIDKIKRPKQSAAALLPSFGGIYAKAQVYKRKAVQVLLNGVTCIARPDSGSEMNIISEAFANQCNIPIDRNVISIFKIGNSKEMRSIGRAFVPCSLFGDNNSHNSQWFHVLAKCVMPVILGMDFLDKTKLFTRNKHLLIDCPSRFGNMPMLKYIGSRQSHIPFNADGEELVGCADTGSDLDFMSPECAYRLGYNIDSTSTARTRVQLVDGSVVKTLGQVRVSSLQIGDFDSFEMDFHVLPGLPFDVIFGEEFLEQINAFNTCAKIMATCDPSTYNLATLINLGPIQTFFSSMTRRCTRKVKQAENTPASPSPEEGGDDMEDEIYRRNLAGRLAHRDALHSTGTSSLPRAPVDPSNLLSMQGQNHNRIPQPTTPPASSRTQDQNHDRIPPP